jgi:hypothetical protein
MSISTFSNNVEELCHFIKIKIEKKQIGHVKHNQPKGVE